MTTILSRSEQDSNSSRMLKLKVSDLPKNLTRMKKKLRNFQIRNYLIGYY